MNLEFKYFNIAIGETKNQPGWADLVERWYQLDAAAYALAESYWQIKKMLADVQPEFLILASPGASNTTDLDFHKSGMASAAKFVHTLPNVRGTSLYQAMKWHGPMLCLQKGPQTLLSAMGEAMDEFQSQPKEIWLFSVLPPSEVLFFRFSRQIQGPLTARRKEKSASDAAQFDSDIIHWLRHPTTQSFKWADGRWLRELRATEFR